MVIVEFFKERKDGVKLYRTYSDAGVFIERDGELYEEAIDPEGTGRVYNETDIVIETEETEEDENHDEMENEELVDEEIEEEDLFVN